MSYDYESAAWSLFCLTDDVSEVNNLAKAEPQVLATLAGQLNAWLRQEAATWQPKYPLLKESGLPAGPPSQP